MLSGKLQEINAMSVDFPAVKGHPNRRPFEGVLTFVDVPSDKSPSGARGHRVVLTKDAAQSGLSSLLGMAVDFCPNWDGHDSRSKCGIITAASIEENRVHVEGFLYGRDFPEVEKASKLQSGKMGMSYELADAHVHDMRAPIWKLTRITFTGAAILLRDKAAYTNTTFSLKA